MSYFTVRNDEVRIGKYRFRTYFWNMGFNEIVVKALWRALVEESGRNAFCIDGTFFTYRDLAVAVSKIRQALRGVSSKHIGLVANDDLETYASILALWFEGKCYIPLHPGQPIERCTDIIEQVGITTLLDSGKETRYENIEVVMTQRLSLDEVSMDIPRSFNDDELAYILFTSGSTGRPKGVPITRGNVAAFIEGFHALGFRLTADDRCLQMFDLTFDLSVQSYLLPLLSGACTYTVTYDRIKYQAVFELLDDHHLTFTMMVPSVIHYLRPYLDELRIEELRYSLFAGEGLNLGDVDCWAECVPNAEIWNVYGPTECTIYCTGAEYVRGGGNRNVNGIMGIGKAMKDVGTIVIDDNSRICKPDEKGELCLSGPQLTPGYWDDETKTRAAFFQHDGQRFYKTGDVCAMNAAGDILYYGRKDSQIKIQGYRIELSEIEHVARKFYNERNAVVALPIYDHHHNCQIHLAVEHGKANSEPELIEYLHRYLPSYMIPVAVHEMKHFPQNANNKIDRRKIAEYIQKNNK